MSGTPTPVLSVEAIGEEFRSGTKTYPKPGPIEGVAHGYRPLTNPCALFYIVTRTFEVNDPDEFRIPWDHPAVRDLRDIPNG